MASQTTTTVGSGYFPNINKILPPGQFGSGPSDARGELYNTNVTIGNPENIVAVPVWTTSGVSVGVTPVKIWDANINYNLAHQRSVTFQNMGPDQVRLGPSSQAVIFPSGFTITPITAAATAKDNSSKIEIKIFKGAEVWASSIGTSQIQILAY